MLQTSKILKSREDWKNKATQRSYEIRELRKTQQRHLKTITELKRMNHELIQVVSNKKKTALRSLLNKLYRQQTQLKLFIYLKRNKFAPCVLAINAVVSYRSIPRILELFKLTIPFELNWTPNFTSVINWTLRLGLGLLKQVSRFEFFEEKLKPRKQFLNLGLRSSTIPLISGLKKYWWFCEFR